MVVATTDALPITSIAVDLKKSKFGFDGVAKAHANELFVEALF